MVHFRVQQPVERSDSSAVCTPLQHPSEQTYVECHETDYGYEHDDPWRAHVVRREFQSLAVQRYPSKGDCGGNEGSGL